MAIPAQAERDRYRYTEDEDGGSRACKDIRIEPAHGKPISGGLVNFSELPKLAAAAERRERERLLCLIEQRSAFLESYACVDVYANICAYGVRVYKVPVGRRFFAVLGPHFGDKRPGMAECLSLSLSLHNRHLKSIL